MGINYYLRKKPCESCGHYESIHIGKFSAGMSFSFHATENIRSYKDWIKEFKKGKIYDEYGQEVSINNFNAMVEAKKGEENHAVKWKNDPFRENFVDEDGNSFGAYEFR